MNNIEGWVTTTFTDKKTGEVCCVFGPEKNIVTDRGIEVMWERASTLDSNFLLRLDNIVLGSDYGDDVDWSIFNPEPATSSFTSDDQVIVHRAEDTQYSYPTDDVLKCTLHIDGQVLMDTYFPSEVAIEYTSMALRFNNDETFAYRRVPIRSISRQVDVDIDWRFRIINADEYCEGTP